MLIPMLNAVLKMLEKPENIECARAVLSEIIKHHSKNPLGLPKSVMHNSLRTYVDDQLDQEVQDIQKELLDE